MKFKTSLFNKGLMISDFKRLWWVSALYALVLFFVFPFSLMMMDQDAIARWKSQYHGMGNLFNNQQIFICIVPVILAVLVFRYLQTARSCAMAHSLPCSRKTLYISHSVSGLALLTAPVFLNAFLLVIVKLTASAGVLITPVCLLKWLGITLVFEILFYSFAIFAGMFTGNSISHLAFTYILNVLPVGLLYLLDFNLRNLIYGYGGNIYNRGIENNLPIFSLSSYSLEQPFLSAHYIIYAVLSVVFFIAAWAVYEKRHLESAGDIITFTSIRPVFKYGITICVTLLSGLYFLNLRSSSFAVVVFGFFISSLLGYYISEVLLQKSLKVWNTYKGYICYAALLILVLAGIKTDISGYIKRVPDASEVKNVYWGYSIEDWQNINRSGKLSYSSDSHIFKDKEDIRNIIGLHKLLLKNRPSSKTYMYRYIIYTLKDGSSIIRQYDIGEKVNASALKPLYESKEYKEARFPILVQKTDDLKYIEISDNRITKKPVVLSSSSEINEFASLLKKDIANLKYESLDPNLSEGFNLGAKIASINGEPILYALRYNYSNVLKWLKEKGYYERVALLPEEVTSIQLINRNDGADLGKSLEIKDIKVIKELLNISGSERPGRNYIEVVFNISRNGWSYSLDPDIPMSDELKEYIKQIQN